MKVALVKEPIRYVLVREDGQYIRIGSPANWVQLGEALGLTFEGQHQDEEWAIDKIISQLDAVCDTVFDVAGDIFKDWKESCQA
ncbi:MAG: hypothetical protein U9N61_10860 [Euryarchaeota archaeon]|nr:hypothetical protein [Euryarchaeota archaeon]